MITILTTITMADQVQWRGGSRENSDNFTGAPREVTVDTTDWILRVHDGLTPGGHKMMKVNDCLVVETADKCNPQHPACKVTVNGELHANGDLIMGPGADAHLGDVYITGCVSNPSEPGLPVQICDDLKVSENTYLDGALVARGNADFKKNVIIEKNLDVEGTALLHEVKVQGCIQHVGDDPLLLCDDVKIGGSTNIEGGLLVGGNADFDENVLIDRNLLVRDNLDVKGTALLHDVKVQGCIQHVGDVPLLFCDDVAISGGIKVEGDIWVDGEWGNLDDSKVRLKTPMLSWGCDNTGCCLPGHPDLFTVEDKLNYLDSSLQALEQCHCQLKSVNNLAHEAIEREIDRVEQMIKVLELQVHQVQNEVAQNTLDIVLLRKEIERLDNNIDAVNQCCTSSSKQICLDESATGLFLTEDGCLTDVNPTP